jgi:hypothetical protein
MTDRRPTPRRRCRGTVGAAGLRVLWLGAGCGPAAPPPPPFEPVADVKQLMAAVVEPAAETYWDAVGTTEDEKGSREFAPETAAEWDAVRNSAYLIAESGNLLMMGGRVRDGGDWIALSRALVEAGKRAIAAAEAKNKDAVFEVGGEVYEACTKCHATYAVELLRPNAQSP